MPATTATASVANFAGNPLVVGRCVLQASHASSTGCGLRCAPPDAGRSTTDRVAGHGNWRLAWDRTPTAIDAVIIADS